MSCASQVPEGGPPQAVPGAAAASLGHALLAPSHVSARSHVPTEGRHGVPAGCTVSGHSTLVPSQTSRASQLGSGRPKVVKREQGVPIGAMSSAGHSTGVSPSPPQVSATSHGPPAGRHTVEGDSMLQNSSQQSPDVLLPSSQLSSKNPWTMPSPQ